MNGTLTKVGTKARETARGAVKSATGLLLPTTSPTLNPPSAMNTSNLQPGTPPESTDRLAFGDDSVLMDPELIKAARQIYRTFYEVHPEVIQRPIGVAMGRLNHRGKLVFGDKPVLLPQECFVPFSQIEPDLV